MVIEEQGAELPVLILDGAVHLSFIESAAQCGAAAAAVGVDDGVPNLDAQGVDTSGMSTGDATIPHGCYWKPAN